MRLYGKETLKKRLDAYAAEGRLPHAILLCGERGAGKRVMANYIAKLFMCGAKPCDSCPVCSKIDSFAHPDIIFVKRECGGKYNLDETGKNGLVSMRRVMESIVIKPNDGDVKIYAFEDADLFCNRPPQDKKTSSSSGKTPKRRTTVATTAHKAQLTATNRTIPALSAFFLLYL